MRTHFGGHRQLAPCVPVSLAMRTLERDGRFAHDWVSAHDARLVAQSEAGVVQIALVGRQNLEKNKGWCMDLINGKKVSIDPTFIIFYIFCYCFLYLYSKLFHSGFLLANFSLTRGADFSENTRQSHPIILKGNAAKCQICSHKENFFKFANILYTFLIWCSLQ